MENNHYDITHRLSTEIANTTDDWVLAHVDDMLKGRYSSAGNACGTCIRLSGGSNASQLNDGRMDLKPQSSTMPDQLTEITKQTAVNTLVIKTSSREHWIHQLKDDLICPICCNYLSNTSNLSCSHLFCHECITKWFENQRQQSCPVCRKLITTPPTPARLIDQLTEFYIKNELNDQNMQQFRTQLAHDDIAS